MRRNCTKWVKSLKMQQQTKGLRLRLYDHKWKFLFTAQCLSDRQYTHQRTKIVHTQYQTAILKTTLWSVQRGLSFRTVPFLFLLLFPALIRSPELPIRVISFTDEPPLSLPAESAKKSLRQRQQRGTHRTEQSPRHSVVILTKSDSLWITRVPLEHEPSQISWVHPDI